MSSNETPLIIFSITVTCTLCTTPMVLSNIWRHKLIFTLHNILGLMPWHIKTHCYILMYHNIRISSISMSLSPFIRLYSSKYTPNNNKPTRHNIAYRHQFQDPSYHFLHITFLTNTYYKVITTSQTYIISYINITPDL